VYYVLCSIVFRTFSKIHTQPSTRLSTHLIPTTITDPVTHIHKYIILKYCLHSINYMVWKMWKMVIYFLSKDINCVKLKKICILVELCCNVSWYSIVVLCILFHQKATRFLFTTSLESDQL
jgi:hypothetical protein